MRTYSQFRPTSGDPAGLALPDRQDWLVLPHGRNRDSGCLGESNFCVILRDLGGEGENVEVHRFGHWACGWFEILIVRPGTAAAKSAEKWEAALANYPVADDEHFSALETEEALHVWRDCYTLRQRHEYIEAHRDQFDFARCADYVGCVRGRYFAGYASELLA